MPVFSPFIRYFDEVARQGSIRRAADRLNVAPSAVNRQILKLEDELGAPLFERYAGKYLAVSEGEVFVAEDAWEARRLARVQHPDDEPFVQHVPRDSNPRIYAC